jgi:hypothetical protein
MGAELNCYSFKDSIGRDAITKTWERIVSDSLYEDGHSYSGAVGMLGNTITWIDMPPCENRETAQEWLSDKHQKWSNAIAVPYHHSGGEKFWLIGGWCSS